MTFSLLAPILSKLRCETEHNSGSSTRQEVALRPVKWASEQSQPSLGQRSTLEALMPPLHSPAGSDPILGEVGQ